MSFLLLLPVALSACVGIYADDRQTSVITPVGVFTDALDRPDASAVR